MAYQIFSCVVVDFALDHHSDSKLAKTMTSFHFSSGIYSCLLNGSFCCLFYRIQCYLSGMSRSKSVIHIKLFSYQRSSWLKRFATSLAICQVGVDGNSALGSREA